MEIILGDTLEKWRTLSVIGIAAMFVTAFVLLQPIQMSFGQTNDLAIQAFEDCKLRSLAEDPINMNTVVGTKGTTPIAKTVFTEKEVYDCQLDQGGVPVIVDVTLIAEIHENMTSQQIVRKQTDVIVCVKKGADASSLGCNKEKPATDAIVTQDCKESKDAGYSEITHPTETNTVVSPADKSIVKTVHAEKEVFLCFPNGSPSGFLKKVDVVLFTEIWEDLDKLSDNPVVKKSALALYCVTNLAFSDTNSIENSIQVESCRFTNVTLI